jgi:hypothetical protein
VKLLVDVHTKLSETIKADEDIWNSPKNFGTFSDMEQPRKMRGGV